MCVCVENVSVLCRPIAYVQATCSLLVATVAYLIIIIAYRSLSRCMIAITFI